MRLWGVLVALLLLATPALADPEREAVVLLTDGAELMRRGELEAARTKFIAARQLVPDRANPYRLLGLVEARLGNCTDAVTNLDEFLRRASPVDARRAEATAVRDDCREQLRPAPARPVVQPAPTPAQPAAPPRSRKTRWIVLGAVTAAVVGGAAVGLAFALRDDDPFGDAARVPEARWRP